MNCAFPNCLLCKMIHYDAIQARIRNSLPEITEASYEWDDTWFFIDNLAITKD